MADPTPTSPQPEPLPGSPAAPDLAAAPPQVPGQPGPHGPHGPRPHQGGSFRGPPRGGDRGEPRGSDRFPRGEKPRNDGSKVPDLTTRDFAAARPNTRELDKGIEDELNAALAGFDVSGSVAKPAPKPKPAFGAQVKKSGTVISIHGKDVFVDVPGGRGQGLLPLEQFAGKAPQVGDVVEFDIEGYDGANGLLRLTMTGATAVVANWSSVSRGMVVEAKVTGTNANKTGLSVEVNGIKGFLPAREIDLVRTENIEALVNQRIKCEVIEVEPSERNLIVSRRALLERERLRLAEAFWAGVEEGQVRDGTVRSVKPFGAFVDLGAVDGLVPISEMSWSRVSDPNELVKVGQKVEVVVHRIDRDARKITLSLRQTIRSPWDDFAEAHKAGARVTGKVSRIADFGAFVEVAPGVEGLVHVSELSTQRVRKVRDVVTEGQAIEVEIQSIDVQARRMSLSLKSIKASAEAAEDEAAEAEAAEDRRSAAERLSTRPVNPNLRGGVGSGPLIDWNKP